MFRIVGKASGSAADPADMPVAGGSLVREEPDRDTGRMAENHPRKPLLEGRSVLPVQEIARRLAVRAEDVAELIERGELNGTLTREGGSAWGLFEDDVPSRERLLELGVRPMDDHDSIPDPYEGPDLPGETTVGVLRW
jgi:hypothetical protein